MFLLQAKFTMYSHVMEDINTVGDHSSSSTYHRNFSEVGLDT